MDAASDGADARRAARGEPEGVDPGPPPRAAWIARTWERWSEGPARSILLLIALGLAVFEPGLRSIPTVDRDEARFAQASRQMFEAAALPPDRLDAALHGGGWIVPMVQDRPRLNKPPLVYWAQAASVALLAGGDPARDAIWMYRGPSVLFGLVAVLATWSIGRSMFGPRVGLLAGALLALCPVVTWEAHQARADMLLLACTTIAMGALWRVWSASAAGTARGWGWPLVFWGALAAGVMAKGPITPMVVLLAALTLGLVARRWAWLLGLRPLVGLGVLVAAVGPWVWAVARQVGWHEYVQVVVGETVGRGLNVREGHWGPPGYHLVLLPVLFWPGSMLTGLGLLRAWRAVRREGERGPLLFCVAWIVPAWIVFELATTKLPHYTMPLYPAIAVLSARAIVVAAEAAPGQWLGRGVRLGLIVWWLIGAVAAAGLLGIFAVWIVRAIATGAPHVPLSARAVAGAALALVGAVLLARALRPALAGSVLRAQASAGAAMACLLIAALGGAVPHLVPGANTAGLAHLAPGWVGRPVATTYHEDSVIFHLRGRVERIRPDDAASWLAAHPGGLAIVPADSPLRSAPGLGEAPAVRWPPLLRATEPTHYVVAREPGLP